MKKRIYLASDHGAVKEKKEIFDFLKEEFQVIDLGTHSEESTHYPEFAIPLAQNIQEGEEGDRGILFCRSGIGVSMVANRFKGVRAARCVSIKDAELSRAHNNANVLCLAADINSLEEIKAIIDKWLATDFEGGRHKVRVDLFDHLGE